jgi:HTH-type transcriptional regulator / antitoxin HigA
MKRTSAKKDVTKIADDYLGLIHQFPLRPIRNEAEYDQAIKVLHDLIGRADTPRLTPGERDYTDALSHFVKAYDDKHYPIEHVLKTPLARLKYLMEQQGMTSGDLGELLGSGKGQASLILNGKRELSKANIRVLANRFKINPGFFL